MRFFLGTHQPSWIGTAGVPLFISRRRLARLKALPRALAPWALDSGGFSELTMFGRWETSPGVYAQEVYRWSEAIGQFSWAAIQDWMCEPIVREGGYVGKRRIPGTGKTVREHQELTIESYQVLQQLAPDLPWVPVLQGWEVEDYLRHVEIYRECGLDLLAAPVVGVGSVCRRESTAQAWEILATLHRHHPDLRLHAFGMKAGGLKRCAAFLESSDSLAWSAGARRRKVRLPGCEHADCRNCLRWALEWRELVIGSTKRRCQPRLF